MNARISSILAPARAIALSANCKNTTLPTPCARPSQRTYYLGINGRVSQRKHLVGELVATVRACSTDHARYLFTNALATIQVQSEKIVVRPYIGATQTCIRCGNACGPKHYDKAFVLNEQRRLVERSGFLCDRCEREVSWGRSGEMETAPATMAERGVICDRASYRTEVVR